MHICEKWGNVFSGEETRRTTVVEDDMWCGMRPGCCKRSALADHQLFVHRNQCYMYDGYDDDWHVWQANGVVIGSCRC